MLASWKCHKVVKTGKIMALPADGPHIPVEDARGATYMLSVPDDTFKRGRPAVGDYIVIYEDGYISWSPAKAFEDGYTRQD